MKRYRNLSGNSGVVAYDIGPDFVRVKFIGSSIYRYTYRSAGMENVECMKRLARDGRGLATFITRRVRDAHEAREC